MRWARQPSPLHSPTETVFEKAALYNYWQRRLQFDWPVSSLGLPSQIFAHLNSEKQIKAPCRLCGTLAMANATLANIWCGRHIVPLCQWSLIPLILEPHLLCGFCGRGTISPALHGCMAGDSPCAPLPGVCAWCASFVSVV